MCWICKAKHSSLINSEIIEFIYNLPHTLLRLGSLETGQYPNAVTSASQLWATGALCTIHYTTIFISLITVLHACLNNELKFLGRELTVMTECVCVRALCDLLGRYDFLLKVIIHRACKGLREYSDIFGFMPRFFFVVVLILLLVTTWVLGCSSHAFVNWNICWFFDFQAQWILYHH